jgi:CRISPR/Cas system CMR-associated protein Cmr1 (group 7 of RAMP superfamily)
VKYEGVMHNLDFIADEKLRQTLDKAIKYVYALFERSELEAESELYEEEAYRVIVLYVVSTIEAILLYIYRARGEKITYSEYRYVHMISPEYRHAKRQESPVVIAVQEQVEKTDYQIGLHELVTFFREKNLVSRDLARNVCDLNSVRNTFHFSKPRASLVCDRTRVESAFKLLVNILEQAPRALEK